MNYTHFKDLASRMCLAGAVAASWSRAILMTQFLPAATKWGQGNVFTGFCDSVHRGGGVCLSACWDASPPRDQRPPRPGRHPPGPGRPPWTRQTPLGADTHPLSRHPPPLKAATAVDGTHPTGMHSCFVTEIHQKY